MDELAVQVLRETAAGTPGWTRPAEGPLIVYMYVHVHVHVNTHALYEHVW